MVDDAAVKKRTDSPYEFVEGLDLDTVHTESGWYEETDIGKLFKDGVYGRIEHAVIDALYKYPYLNGRTLYRYLNLVCEKNEDGWYFHIVSKMREDFTVRALRYGGNMFYTIPSYVRKFWTAKKKFVVQIPKESVETVLSCASLAQWHVSMMEGEKLVCNILYQQKKIAKETVTVPSCMEIVKHGTRYRIFSFSLPKGNESVNALLGKLSHMWHLMERSRRKNQITLTVFVAASFTEMKAMHELLKLYKPADNHRVYYVLDGNTYEFSGFGCLYYYLEEDGECLLKTISVS